MISQLSAQRQQQLAVKPTSPLDGYPPFRQLINSPHISCCGCVISNRPFIKKKKKKIAMRHFILINTFSRQNKLCAALFSRSSTSRWRPSANLVSQRCFYCNIFKHVFFFVAFWFSLSLSSPFCFPSLSLSPFPRGSTHHHHRSITTFIIQAPSAPLNKLCTQYFLMFFLIAAHLPRLSLLLI